MLFRSCTVSACDGVLLVLTDRISVVTPHCSPCDVRLNVYMGMCVCARAHARVVCVCVCIYACQCVSTDSPLHTLSNVEKHFEWVKKYNDNASH